LFFDKYYFGEQIKKNEKGHEWEIRERYTGFWWGKPKTRDRLEDLGVDGRIALKCILNKQYMSVWSGFIWIRIGNVMWSCERDNEPLVSIKKGISLSDEKIVTFEKGPHFVDLVKIE